VTHRQLRLDPQSIYNDATILSYQSDVGLVNVAGRLQVEWNHIITLEEIESTCNVSQFHFQLARSANFSILGIAPMQR
jgi:hypothetical protein